MTLMDAKAICKALMESRLWLFPVTGPSLSFLG